MKTGEQEEEEEEEEGMLTYQGYVGRIEVDEGAGTFFGTVINANILIHFRGRSIDDLRQSFHDVVDTYVEDCRNKGLEPERPYSGKITLRVAPDTHRRAVLKAASCKQSMNEYLERLLERDTADLAEACS